VGAGATRLVAKPVTAESRTMRYWSRLPLAWAVTALFLLMPFCGVWLAWFSSDALATGRVAPGVGPFAVIGIVVGLLWIGLACLFLPLALRPALVVSAEMLRIRHVYRQVRVPVGEVTGVGLVFRRYTNPGRTGPAPGWYLMVWHGDSAGELAAAICFTPTLRNVHDPRGWEKFLARPPAAPAFGGTPSFSTTSFDPAAVTDPAKLADTYAGRVARDTYLHVLERQGPAGLLALTQQQKHVAAAGQTESERVLAFWSPDGVIGRTEAGSPDHAA